MEFNIFTLIQGIVLVTMAYGIIVMSSGIIREDFIIFKKSLYLFVVCGIVSIFMALVKNGALSVSSGFETPLLVVSLVLVALSVFSISYHHIHAVIPQVFVKASSLFSVLVLAANLLYFSPLSKSLMQPTGTRHKFIESNEYQAIQERAQAGFASNP